MSRAFVREGDGDEAPELFQRAPRLQPCYITRAGYLAAHAEFDRLQGAVGAHRLEDLALDARGVWHQQQARLRELGTLLTEVTPVDPPAEPLDDIHFGALVTVEQADGATQELQLVGEDEALPEAGRINWRSPLGRVLMGARVGDEVEWRRPAGTQLLLVLAVRYA
jgi:transcription elongation GreA/GreB family factor